MKKVFIIVLLITSLCYISSSSEKLICKGPNPGEIYIVGPDISEDSLTGRVLYHSMDYGSTLVKKYEDPGMLYFWYITADATPGGVYRQSSVHALYYSTDYGENWVFKNENSHIITSGIITGIIYDLCSGTRISHDYGVNFTTKGSSPGNGLVIGSETNEIYEVYDREGEVYFSSDTGETFELTYDFSGHLYSLARGYVSGEVYVYKAISTIFFSSDYGETFDSVGFFGDFSLGDGVEICSGNSPGELFAIRVEYYERPMYEQRGGEIKICYSTDYGGTFDCIDYSSRYVGIDEFDFCIKPDGVQISVYPNPFNSSCQISTPIETELEILDISGRIIDEFDGGDQIWIPENSVGSGVYFIRANIGDKWSETKKVIYLK